jgi:hypothetical protein
MILNHNEFLASRETEDHCSLCVTCISKVLDC